jgi:hypothetical protein
MAVKESENKPFIRVGRAQLLANDEFIEQKRVDKEATDWFRKLYIWLANHPLWEKQGKKYNQLGYWNKSIILASDGNLYDGGKVWIPDFQPTDPILKGLANITK